MRRSVLGILLIVSCFGVLVDGEAATRFASPSGSGSACTNVGTPCALQTAIDQAVQGDTVQLANGTYNGLFGTNSSGASGNPITLKAANRHQAILSNANGCSSEGGLYIENDWWIVEDLRFSAHHDAIRLEGVSNNIIRHNIIENFGQHGVRGLTGSNNNLIEENVITRGATCYGGGEGAGIVLIDFAGIPNTTNNTILNNIIYDTGNNECVFGCDKAGYGILIANNADDNTVKGNLLLGNGGKGQLRVLFGSSALSTTFLTGTIIQDNIILWGEGESSTNDCNDHQTSLINNLMGGTMQSIWSTKGNVDGNRGQHVMRHNTFILDAFSRIGAGWGSMSGDAICVNGGYKVQNTMIDNLFYSPDNDTSGFHKPFGNDAPMAEGFASGQVHHNWVWANDNSNSWILGSYTPQTGDLISFGSAPTFEDAAGGDWEIADGTLGAPGNNPASDSTKRGINWNSFLKRQWALNVWALETRNQATSGSIHNFTAVDPDSYYQVWFYAGACTINETFVIEGETQFRDLTTGNYNDASQILMQSFGKPARWLTLGRHKATDGTLTVDWGTSNCVERLFIRRLPTADEAYTWITGAAAGPDVPFTASSPVASGSPSTLTYGPVTGTGTITCTPSIVSGSADANWTGTSSANLIAGTGSPKSGTARTTTTVYRLSCTDDNGTTDVDQTVAVTPTGGFTDDFSDNNRNAALWNIDSVIVGTTDALVTVAETSAQVHITPRTSQSGERFNGYTTVNTYDLTGGHTSIEVVQAATHEALSLAINSTNWYRIVNDGGTLYFQDKIAGVSTYITVDYVNADHRWWRIRHDAATDEMVFETSTSANGGASWDEQRRIPLVLTITDMFAEFNSGTYDPIGSPGVAIFDNFTLLAAGGDATAPAAPANLRVVQP